MQYTSLAAVKSFGQFEGDDDDVLLDALISGASKAINNYCKRIFQIDDETTRTFTKSSVREDAFDGAVLLLDEDLAEAPSSVTGDPTVRYIPENDPPYYALEIVDASWESVVEIVGYWGYSKTPPPDIEFACLRLVKWMHDLRDTSKGNVVVVTPEGRVLLPQGLPSDIREFINPYKRVLTA